MGNDLHMEKIIRINFIVTALNRKKLGDRRIVDLACGHKAITRATNRCICLRCKEMFRRSCLTGEEDWDAFRHSGQPDHMIWREDPLRGLNERTDSVGNFLND